VADALDGAREEPPLARVVELAEAQRVEQGDRPRAHREDVAEDTADAGRGALKGLHGGGVVVAFDLERDREPVADVDHAGVLAGALEDALAGGGEAAQEQARVLVAAVLAPEQRVHRELEVVRLAGEVLADAVELAVGEAERAVDSCGRHAHAATPAAARCAAASASSPRSSTAPSVEPSSGSTACSGCGMRPATLPAAFVMPATAATEPFTSSS
jgi:hypothetical protein